MKPDQIRLQDVGSVFGTVASNHVATELVFNYFFDNWERLNARFQGQLFVLKRIAGACLNVGYTEKHYNRIKDFMESHPKETADIIQFRKALDGIRVRIAWIDKHLNPLLDYFKQNHCWQKDFVDSMSKEEKLSESAKKSLIIAVDYDKKEKPKDALQYYMEGIDFLDKAVK
ncbi:hypothetical protein GCK32_012634 [Trichostrongylus colubriformis]|uniref:ERAP1-like C-terminal domain-containing protein n=1 Tax=Trichostrongylus colubriformis TaxID=6319 RepID=A0AAN8G0Q9_TRICO